ncbi:hypothetical protein PSU4_38840 [Pseudonocardia sulfidoxydans NBRC 16205]|uniref:Uncharacterized protein n=1 Tax=Pseudonocardia sulfidoxydans NBRC 16205 TaxID=1223511 RepID=A0A511DJE5_9PSEU|nr:hypothetical protein [Pseudonocardia sulfidoxydans]GEL24930.1 hypothetical protein PSU4_38840 [Pseudonocardia sulfidoxydans NBRC 16205]
MGNPEDTRGIAAGGEHIPINSRPGTGETVELGCRCPVLVNGPATPSAELLVAPDCGMHAVV